jgi:hypothetical protein
VVIPAIGTTPPPGTTIVNEYAPAQPTIALRRIFRIG